MTPFEFYVAELLKHGIDRDDPKYHVGSFSSPKAAWCLCGLHQVDRPRPGCDLDQEKVRRMREQGLDAYHCRICFTPYVGQPFGLCEDHASRVKPTPEITEFGRNGSERRRLAQLNNPHIRMTDVPKEERLRLELEEV